MGINGRTGCAVPYTDEELRCSDLKGVFNRWQFAMSFLR